MVAALGAANEEIVLLVLVHAELRGRSDSSAQIDDLSNDLGVRAMPTTFGPSRALP